MNKAQLVERLAQKVQLSKTQTENFLDATLDIIQEAVAQGEGVKLVGFGSFSLAARKARTGRNSQTGKAFNLPATNVPRFRAGKDFKTFVAQKSKVQK